MKKEPNRSVATLRKIIGKTQEQFAVMLGVSKDAIVSVENGRNRLSPGMATRIYVATGATKASLLENKGVIRYSVRDEAGNTDSEYTRESFERWWMDVFEPDPDSPLSRKRTAQFFFDHLKGRLEVLLIAAARPGLKGRDRLPSVIDSLENWLQCTYENFELAAEVDQVLREETSFTIMDRLSVGFLRNAMKQGNPMGFKFKDSRKLKDTDIVDVEHDFYDNWDGPYIQPPTRDQGKARVVKKEK